MHLRNVAARCSSTARFRVLVLITQFFSASSLLASAIYSSNLLILLEAEVNKSDDMLMALSALELLYELADSTNATKLLASMISNSLADSSLRMRAIMISGRLLSKEETFGVIDMSSIKLVVSAIYERLKLVKNEDTDENEIALEALGQIGSSNLGAALLLSGQSPAASHDVMTGFEQLGRGRQLGLFLSVLRQDSEIRMAAYKSLSGLVKWSWCLVEVCFKQEIIDIVTDPAFETTKNAMEARHNCCIAIYAALTITNDPRNSLSSVAQKLQEAVARGPYLAKECMESQPVVIPAERF